ncbi:MAG: hypothetical protein DME12_18990 [Candidatus Rokuibacteriota bacterium]|nr:MAG: hypothetical protein DME12_18990 [Candidatus Rokubacteria bacterium]
MQIGSVDAVDFRNYRTLSLAPGPRLNVLSGPNGQGKTNLLEALGLLVTGRSFRTPRIAEIPRWGSRSASLTGDLVSAAAASPSRRTVRRTVEQLDDGRWQSRGEAVEWARAIAFGWQDLEIVNGAPSARRGFIDGVAGRLYPAHRAALIQFRQILTRRNRLLQGGSGDAATRARLGEKRRTRRRSSRRSSGRSARRFAEGRPWWGPTGTTSRSRSTAPTPAPSGPAGSSGSSRWRCAWPSCCRSPRRRERRRSCCSTTRSPSSTRRPASRSCVSSAPPSRSSSRPRSRRP